MSQIIENIASNQYGSQEVDCKCLGKYLKKVRTKLKTKELIEEELKQGIEIIKISIKHTNGNTWKIIMCKKYIYI